MKNMQQRLETLIEITKSRIEKLEYKKMKTKAETYELDMYYYDVKKYEKYLKEDETDAGGE